MKSGAIGQVISWVTTSLNIIIETSIREGYLEVTQYCTYAKRKIYIKIDYIYFERIALIVLKGKKGTD